MAPWAKAYTVDIKDIYTELSLEKIENQTTGPEGKIIEDYKELFAERNVSKETGTAEFLAKKILMKADPGMGKTTHGKKIAYDWAEGLFTSNVCRFLRFHEVDQAWKRYRKHNHSVDAGCGGTEHHTSEGQGYS